MELSPEQGEELFKTLPVRFERNTNRHEGLAWTKVQAKLESHPGTLSSLHAMESTGGEPDIVGYDKMTGDEYIHPTGAAVELAVEICHRNPSGKTKNHSFTSYGS